MRPPCELIVRYVLPAFRSLVAKELVGKYNFSQMAVAEKLGTTQATISYYLYSKRGDKRLRQLESIPSIQSAATKIAQGIATKELSPLDPMLTFCKLCTVLRNRDIVCDLHRRDITSLPKDCDICERVTKET